MAKNEVKSQFEDQLFENANQIKKCEDEVHATEYKHKQSLRKIK